MFLPSKGKTRSTFAFCHQNPCLYGQVDSISVGSAEHSESLWPVILFSEQNEALKRKGLEAPHSQPFFSFKVLLP